MSVFQVGNEKIALVGSSMVVTYYIKLFRTGAERHKNILMSLLALVAETISGVSHYEGTHTILYPGNNSLSTHTLLYPGNTSFNTSVNESFCWEGF